jgi:membrane protein YqaA with SNARE-associated domain
VHLYPERAALAVAIATLGNTAGGMTTYGIGRLIPQKEFNATAVRWLGRYGSAATALAWLPVIGDALCVTAGWLRMHWFPVLAFMAAGRLARYIVVASLA